MNVMCFADFNNDKYTDIITIDDKKTSFTIHLFELLKHKFTTAKTYHLSDCKKITNIAVGRSISKLRIFLTCTQSGTGSTIMHLFDRQKDVDFV